MGRLYLPTGVYQDTDLSVAKGNEDFANVYISGEGLTGPVYIYPNFGGDIGDCFWYLSPVDWLWKQGSIILPFESNFNNKFISLKLVGIKDYAWSGSGGITFSAGGADNDLYVPITGEEYIPPPYISTSTTEINFGDVLLGQEVTANFTFFGDYLSSYVYTQMSWQSDDNFLYSKDSSSFSSDYYSFYPSNGYLGSTTIWAKFKPLVARHWDVNINFYDGDTNENLAVVMLRGNAVSGSKGYQNVI